MALYEGITPWQIPVYSFDKEKAKESAKVELKINTVKRRTSILNDF